MKLCRFARAGRVHMGAVDGALIADLSAQGVSSDINAILAGGAAMRTQIEAAAVSAPRIAREGVRLLAPVAPCAFYAVGMNYTAHVREMGRAPPEAPTCFMKPPGCVIGPDEDIVRPRGFRTLDYEGELGLVIGVACRDVSRAEAMSVVAGFVIVNDLSVRELLSPDRLVLAKGCDTFGPIGPWLTSARDIDLQAGLGIRTWVNGALRQDSNTRDMIFPPEVLIETLSRGITLYPGDVITTGSPPGSGAGFSPPRYLEPGDLVEIEIEGLGRLRNRVTALD
jgi:2-keto-4-pentenoate hydratase/2-oxohepta-3-ene-1,7-dioic acid hydratase in catechol pathway